MHIFFNASRDPLSLCFFCRNEIRTPNGGITSRIVQKVVEEGVPNAYARDTPSSTESEVRRCTSPLKRVLNGIDALRHDLQSVRLRHALRPAPSS